MKTPVSTLTQTNPFVSPIYDLTKKGTPFQWDIEQQEAFEEIKRRMQSSTILYMADNRGRFHLYSFTSKFAAGSSLYQIQNGQPKMTAYVSKRMPAAAQNYSIRVGNVWIIS